MATFGTPKVVDLTKWHLTQRYVSGINDDQTLALGNPGIYKVMSRIGSGQSGALNTATGLAGTAATTRRVQARLTNAGTGTVGFDVGLAGSTVVVMTWSSR